MVITQSGSTIGGPVLDKGLIWEEATAGNIVLQSFACGELFEKIVTALSTGSGDFDVLIYAADYLDAIQNTINHPKTVLDIRITGSAEYLSTLDAEIANALEIFMRITVPILLPISMTVILKPGFEIFKIIDVVAVTTGGGPGSATESLTPNIFEQALSNGNYGYASAIAYVLLILVIIFATLFLMAGQR